MRGDRIDNSEPGNPGLPDGSSTVTDRDDGFNYLPWLIGSVWPSTSKLGAHGDPSVQVITEMPPQHACSCLAKLVRWARHTPVGDLIALDVEAREVAVRTSQLGLHLAARAMSMFSPEDVYALFHDTTEMPVGADVPTIAVLEVIYDVLVELNPMANGADLASPAASIASALLRRWAFTAKI